MKTIRKKIDLMKVMILLVLVFNATIMNVAIGQDKKILIYDAYHGQNPKNGETFNSLLPSNSGSLIELNTKEISDTILKDKDGLILFSPTKTFSDNEKQVIVKYLQSGGSLFLIFDEERRTSLNLVGVNNIIIPFGIELTEDALFVIIVEQLLIVVIFVQENVNCLIVEAAL